MILRTSTKIGLAGWLAALGMIALFFVMQAATLSYGTRINSIPFIRDYHVKTDVIDKSGLRRDQLVGSKMHQAESLDLWMVRFKLYPVEADEVLSIMSLARIKPSQLQLDPKFYQYGGAFLYPLGGWYLALSKIGIVHVEPLAQMLGHPQQIDRIWVAGRAFVLVAFAFSAILLFLALQTIAPLPIAIFGLAIYLFCPASIMFSQVVKPHWYALLWVNAALLIFVRGFVHNKLTLKSELLLAAAIGLAVGSAMTFSMFSALLWGALVVLVLRGGLSAVALLRVPAFAVVTFLLSNPYYAINWRGAQVERAAAAAWFNPSIEPEKLLMFVQNSLFSGFGIALTLLIFSVAVWWLYYGPTWARLFALAVATPITIMAIMTANLATWNVNFRYIPYVLPIGLLLLTQMNWRYRSLVMVICAIATAVQATPLKIAYFDENSESHSTRLLAAKWIDTNIPRSSSICLTTTTLAPFEVPPFRFDEYAVNTPDCRWMVRIERNPRAVTIDPPYQIAKRFTPRFSPQIFPLVWEHINPQITIYRKAD